MPSTQQALTQTPLAPQSPSAAAIRCWTKYFSNVDRTLPPVTISAQWVDFFTLLLLKPGSFEWAQSFLQSPAWAALNQLFSGNYFTFSLPNSPPSVLISDYSCSDPPAPVCLQLLEEDAENDASDSPVDHMAAITSLSSTQELPENSVVVMPPPLAPPTSAPRAKRGKAIHISDVNVRRSERVHNRTQGFKSSICKDKNCVGCSANPPPLSPSVVRDLGSTFYQLDPAALTDEELQTNRAKPGDVGRPKAKKAKSSDANMKIKSSEDNKKGAGPSKSKK